MNVAWMIARRYVRPTKISVITIIGGISVLGIVIGTAALVIVMSLFNGFRGVARDLMIGFGPHVVVSPNSGQKLLEPGVIAAELNTVLDRTVGPSDVAEVATSKLVIIAAGRTGAAEGVALIDPQSPVFSGLRTSMILGTYTFHLDNMDAVVVSTTLAEQLQLRLRDTLELLSPSDIERSLLSLNRPSGHHVIVAGIFQSNIVRDADASRMYLAADAFAHVTHSFTISALYASVSKPRALVNQKADIETQLKDRLANRAHTQDSGITSSQLSNIRVSTWEDLNRGLVDTMRLERLGSFIVLALIVLVASFNVLVSLTLGVVEKRRDIAVLIGLGLAAADIRRIYLIQGLTIGTVSVLLGLCIGLGVCWGQLTFHWIAFDMSKGFLVPFLPLEIQLSDVVAVGTIGLILASLAAIYPATRAARTAISDAIRAE